MTTTNDPTGVLVNVDTFARAESDRYLDDLAAGVGLNRWRHTYEPAQVEDQRVIRLNRDTLYSYAVVDISRGADLVLPETGGRYQTAMVVNQDHYVNRVLDRPGTYRLTVEEFDTPFVVVAVRTLVDAGDPVDVKAANALQDQLVLRAAAAGPFTHPDWDRTSLDWTRSLLLDLAADVPDQRGAFGSRETTEPVRHLLGTASGWGGLPEDQAFYVDVHPGLPVGHYRLTVRDVPVRAFWSVTVYDRDGYMERNDQGRYSVNSVTAWRDTDGSVPVNLGGDLGLPNQIPLPEGWNYMVRLYQPGAQVLDGSWTFPPAEAVR